MLVEELKRQKRIHGLPEEVSEREIALLHMGVPIQKIIGFIQFDDVKINVNRHVLIPRYETEEVVHEALKYINESSRVLDLCCGSGYIGLTIKKKTNATVVMSDICKEAIKQSKENAKLNHLDVQIIKSDLFENIEGKFDVIISNPPYIPTSIQLDSSVYNYEPYDALFAGRDGNELYARIIEQIEEYLNPGGTIVFEISEDNYKFIKQHGFKVLKDINGKNRIAIKKTA